MEDEAAIVSFLRDTSEPIKFLQKYMKEKHGEDMTIIIGHDQVKFLPNTYILFFTDDSIERQQAWKNFVKKGYI